LGAEKVSLVGISTGSEIGLEYVRRHGDRVAHAVLAGVQGPDQLVDLPSEQEAVLGELTAVLRARQPQAPDVAATVGAVVRALAAHPAEVRVRDRRSGDSVTVRLGALDAQLLASATLGDRRQMALLPVLYGRAAAGDYAPLAAMKLEAARAGINSPFEALQDCQTGVAAARLRAREREARTALLGWGTLDFPEHCAGWGVPRLDASWRAPVRSPASVLLVSGTLDGRTSVRNAEQVLRGLPNGAHLVIGGASHGDDLFLSSPRIIPTILAFLRGERPAVTRLEAEPLPQR
ncbi:MAG TPA: alpha/beta hydrolase, partial [Longimicrobium sp.]